MRQINTIRRIFNLWLRPVYPTSLLYSNSANSVPWYFKASTTPLTQRINNVNGTEIIKINGCTTKQNTYEENLKDLLNLTRNYLRDNLVVTDIQCINEMDNTTTTHVKSPVLVCTATCPRAVQAMAARYARWLRQPPLNLSPHVNGLLGRSERRRHVKRSARRRIQSYTCLTSLSHTPIRHSSSDSLLPDWVCIHVDNSNTVYPASLVVHFLTPTMRAHLDLESLYTLPNSDALRPTDSS